MDPELEEQLARAAEAEGVSASDFIREAVRDRSERVLGRTLRDELADVIGAVGVDMSTGARQSGGEKMRIAERTGDAFTELLLSKRRRDLASRDTAPRGATTRSQQDRRRSRA